MALPFLPFPLKVCFMYTFQSVGYSRSTKRFQPSSQKSPAALLGISSLSVDLRSLHPWLVWAPNCGYSYVNYEITGY